MRRFCRIGLLLAIGIILILFAIKPGQSKASENFSYNIRVVYDVQDSGNTHVSETYTVTNNTSNKYLESIQLSTPTDELTNLSVHYSDGANIPATQQKQKTDDKGYTYEYQQISLSFPRRSVGQGSSSTFTVSYDTTKLVESKGDAHIVYIPGIAADSSDSYAITLNVPTDFGPVHGVGSTTPTATQLTNKRQFSLAKKDLSDHSIALLFGDSTTYQANFNFPLNNPTNLAKTFTVTLPPNMPSQQVFVNGIDPKPDSTSVDADGNILAVYKVSAQTNVTVKTNVMTVVKYLEYDLSKSGTKADIPSNLVAEYTGPSKYWQSTNPTIVKKAQELTAGKKTVADQVKAINDYVIDTLDYNNDKIKYNIRQGAVQALANPGNAVCLEYSDLTIALLRAAGIPARMPIGYGYSGNLKSSSDVSDSLHSWVETYVPGIGWMNVDPTWGEKFKNFGYSDLDHFAFALWGVKDGEPVAVADNGNDANYQYENTKLNFTTFQPRVAEDTQLTATKWVVLPFVSVIQYNGRGPSNVASSDLIVSTSTSEGTTHRQLGNLAPSQRFWGLLGYFGQGFISPSQVDLTHSGSQTVLASAHTSLNYWPVIIISIIVTVIVVIKVLQLLSKRRERARPNEPQLHAEDEQTTKAKK